MGLYFYELKWYDECDGKEIFINGILYAESYTEAMTSLADFYDDNAIIWCHLTAGERAGIFELSIEDYAAVAKSEDIPVIGPMKKEN